MDEGKTTPTQVMVGISRSRKVKYRGAVISRVKGSVCFVLKLALPPFSIPLEGKFQNKTGKEPLTQ